MVSAANRFSVAPELTVTAPPSAMALPPVTDRMPPDTLVVPV